MVSCSVPVAAGSGTGMQDLAVAHAGAATIEGEEMFTDFKPMGGEHMGACAP